MNKLKWALAAVTVSMTTASASVTHAQDLTTNTGSASSMSGSSMATNRSPIDYSVLLNPSYDYVDLAQARAEGFSNRQVAIIAKIADRANVPFKYVSELALSGRAFPTIAYRYNLRLADVLNVSDYEDKINNYRMAYENTGRLSQQSMVAGSQQSYSRTSNMTAERNILDTAMQSSNLTMFVKAVKAADLTNTLSGAGSYTVFAPTDAAFSKLTNDQLDALLADKTLLRRVIQYHIIPQRIDAASALAMTNPTSPATLEGDALQVTSSGSTLMINSATVTQPDVLATNGVIHEIDTVLMPPGSSIPAASGTGTSGTGTSGTGTNSMNNGNGTGTTGTGNMNNSTGTGTSGTGSGTNNMNNGTGTGTSGTGTGTNGNLNTNPSGATSGTNNNGTSGTSTGTGGATNGGGSTNDNTNTTPGSSTTNP